MKLNAGMQALLDMNGCVFTVHEESGYWVKFEVKLTDSTVGKPHGISYSLTLHNRRGDRLVGFDNAHPLNKDYGNPFDHHHRHDGDQGKKYDFYSAEKLLSDFWKAVDQKIEEL